MSIYLTTGIYALVFVGALLAFEGVRQLLLGRSDPGEATSRRMRMYRQGNSGKDILQQLRRSPDRYDRLEYLRRLDAALGKAGFTIELPTFLLFCIAGAALLFLLTVRFVGPLPAGVLSLVAAVLVPKFVVERLADQRGKMLIAQLPDALDKMARGLRVGHPINITLEKVAREAKDPLGTELGIVVDQIVYGDDLITAVRDLADRIDLEDVHFFAVAIGIQHGTGGNLARILATLAKVIRDRQMMRRRIRAISSEGRVTMVIMTIIPPAIAGVMMIVAPGYFGDVADDPIFIPAMSIVAILTVLNFLTLRKLVNFRV